MSGVIKDPFNNPTGALPPIKFAFVGGGAAGDHTVTGIDPQRDRLLYVWHLTLTLTEGAPNTTNAWTGADLTSEFQGASVGITAADTINNAGGTDTSNDLLFVVWVDADLGETSNAAYVE